MAFVRLTEDQIRQLRQTDSPTIANVIELFGIRSRVAGYSSAALKAVYPELPPAVGYAVTATLRTGSPPETSVAYGMPALLEAAMQIPAPRMIVFQDLDDPPRAATYGEIMAKTFQTFGFAGLITNGAARDIEQVRRLNFPCWATGNLVAHGYVHFLEFNVGVNVCGVSVQSGDLIHADANGVIQIPSRIAAGVADLCEPYLQAEQIALDYLETPPPTLEGYRDIVERLKAEIAALEHKAKEISI